MHNKAMHFERMEMWEIACFNVFPALCHCNKHSSLIISPTVSAIFISLQRAKCKNWQTLKMTHSGTTFCSLNYCNSHVTNLSNFTNRSVPVTLCRNDLGKLNHNILIWGNGFPTCVLQSLWGRMQRTIALEVAPGVGSKERNIGWVPNFSHTPLSTREVTY